MNTETKNCQSCKNSFVIETEDFQFYERIKVPPPTWCPECRLRRRLMFWNQNNLFRKKDAITGKEIFSTYPEEANIVIYDHDYWWSDAWDPMSYGKDVDFSRPFLEQVQELNTTVPWPAKSVQQMVNSDYCNQCSRNKNCYLCFNGNNSEDSAYCVGFSDVKSSFDLMNIHACELCYELLWANNCYQTFFSVDSNDCRNVWFSKDCANCEDCMGCVGLRNKKYHILNQPYSEEEYKEKIATLNLGSYAANRAFYEEVRELWKKTPVKYLHGYKNVDVTMGDYVENSKNMKYCFETYEGENLRYCQNIAFNIKDSYDYTNWGLNSELIYESVSVGENCSNVRFSFDCWPNCTSIEYSFCCHSSSDLFGCVGLKSKQHCILNKQYSKEEYFALREKIIAHMKEMPYVDKQGRKYPYGEMFPAEFSPLAYNETAVIDYYPRTKEEALSEGFLWRDPNPREFQITMSASDLPDHINDATEAITKEAIGCISCGRAYRIIPSELEFYKRFSLPLPRKCHACRYRDRLSFRNPMQWYRRTCDCHGAKSVPDGYTNAISHFHGEGTCSAVFDTTYPPEKKDIVYCERCYQGEMA